MPISKFHQAALNCAAAGIPVFPCLPNAKAPACSGGFKDATTDQARIDAWWSENPNYNLAFSPEDAGWFVIDSDPGAASIGLPKTYTVQTPRGGYHFYFEGSGPSTASKLADHVDTRGRGGYVLLPPSIVNNKPYEVIYDRDLAPLPGWVQSRLTDTTSPARAAIANLDLPGNIDRARKFLHDLCKTGDTAISGRGGNNRSYQVACELLNLGLSEGVCLTLLTDLWNPKCIPPWDGDELRNIVVNASRYAQNEAGAWAAPPAAEVFSGQALDTAMAEDEKQQEARSKFHFDDETEMESALEPSWILPELIPEATTILLYGATGSFKSFLAQDIAMSVSAGVPFAGIKPAVTGPTFYGALEGRNAIKKKRRRAWKAARGIDSLPDFYVGRAPMITIPEEIQQFGDAIIARCAGRKPRIVVLDTISKSMVGLNENDAGDASKFIRFADSLVEFLGCTVIAVGHTGKDEGRGHRGSGAFPAGLDTVIEVKAKRESRAVSLTVLQHKDAPEPETPWTFEGREIAGSLVFFPTTASEHRTLTVPLDEFAPKKVGKALQNLNAYGAEQGVTTAVLAVEMIGPCGEQEAQEAHQERLSRACRTLASLAKGKLELLCTRTGRDLSWHIMDKS